MALTEKLTAIGDAIRSKTGGGEKLTLEQMVTEIEGISTGSGGGADTGEEWVGDGRTHIWVELAEGRTSPKLGICLNGTATIDWGDGTAPEILTAKDIWNLAYSNVHNYEKAGRYHIAVAIEGAAGLKGMNPSSNLYVSHLLTGEGLEQRLYGRRIKKVEVGGNVTYLFTSSLAGCYGLEAVKIADTVSQIHDLCFLDNTTLKSVKFPAMLPEIKSHLFAGCKSLDYVKIPASVNKVGSRAFDSCDAMSVIDFSEHTAVPTLAGSDAFAFLPKDCEIRVPAALYEEWIAATNWVTFASQIKAV